MNTHSKFQWVLQFWSVQKFSWGKVPLFGSIRNTSRRFLTIENDPRWCMPIEKSHSIKFQPQMGTLGNSIFVYSAKQTQNFWKELCGRNGILLHIYSEFQTGQWRNHQLYPPNLCQKELPKIHGYMHAFVATPNSDHLVNLDQEKQKKEKKKKKQHTIQCHPCFLYCSQLQILPLPPTYTVKAIRKQLILSWVKLPQIVPPSLYKKMEQTRQHHISLFTV